MEALSSNEAAARALQLFTSHAPLCDSAAREEEPTSSLPTAMDTSSQSSSSSTASSVPSVPHKTTPSIPAAEDDALREIALKKVTSEANTKGTKKKEKCDTCEGGLSYELLIFTKDQCIAEKNWAKLRGVLWSVFSNELPLKNSFAKKTVPKESKSNIAEAPAQPMVVDPPEPEMSAPKDAAEMSSVCASPVEMSSKEKLRASQVDMDKDIDSTADCDSMSCDESSKHFSGDIEEKVEANTSMEAMQVEQSAIADDSCASAAQSSSFSDTINSQPSCSTSSDVVDAIQPGSDKDCKVLGLPVPAEVTGQSSAVGYTVIKEIFPEPELDFEDLHKSYALLKTVPESEYVPTLLNAQIRLLKDHLAIKFKASKSKFRLDLKIVDIIIILLENPFFISENDYTESILEPLSEFLTILGERQKAMLCVYLAKNWLPSKLESLVSAFHHLITIKLITTESGIGSDYDM